jgi:hypothetical protein
MTSRPASLTAVCDGVALCAARAVLSQHLPVGARRQLLRSLQALRRLHPLTQRLEDYTAALEQRAEDLLDVSAFHILTSTKWHAQGAETDARLLNAALSVLRVLLVHGLLPQPEAKVLLRNYTLVSRLNWSFSAELSMIPV